MLVEMVDRAISAFREDYSRACQGLEKQFFESLDPNEYLEAHTRTIEEIISAAVRPHLERADFGVVAVGGYGRRELFPKSDIDLLVVYSDEAAVPAISDFLHDLWDIGFKLGHQVWSLREIEELDLAHRDFVFSVLDARMVTETERLSSGRLADLLSGLLSRCRGEIVEKIVEATLTRHSTFGDTIYQLEPDIKDSPGGLRDHHAAKWLGGLLPMEPFLPYTKREIAKAHLFLQKLRVLLHLLSRRADNRLSHTMQERLAAHLGYRTETPRGAVERLMKEYFQNSRTSFNYCNAWLELARPSPTRPAINVLQPDTELPADWMKEVFLKAVREGRQLDDRVRAQLLEALPAVSASINFATLREDLLELFKPRPGLYRVLSTMYELGYLELLFPEFTSIKSLVIRDFYHRYTVDEHTLLAIRNIEELAAAGTDVDGRFSLMLEESVEPSLLTLALLLHDVGKSREGKHSDRSARMATQALRRLRFEKSEIDLVSFLIRNHLAMSAVILRRDVEDDEVVEAFANLVGDTERLRLLTLLTFADIKAVAPGTLNEWKKDLLWQLYVSTYRKLTVGYGEERIQDQDIEQRLLESLAGQAARDELENFVEGFPVRYLRSTSPDEILNHFKMVERLNSKHPVETRFLNRKSHHDLWVVTPDRAGLFSKIAGLLAYFEMNILRGYGFSNRRQIILDFFQFVESPGASRLNTEKRRRLHELLELAIKEEVSVDDLLAGKERSVLFQRKSPYFEPSLYFEDEGSNHYTILELVAPDALGLLYRVSREIAQVGCDIDLALISTEGDKAVDVFYLRHAGGKLSAVQKQELRNRISGALHREQP